jgi:hypothetical protein
MSRTSPTFRRATRRSRARLVLRVLVLLTIACMAAIGIRSGIRHAQRRIRDELHRRVMEFARRSHMEAEFGEVTLENSSKVSVRNISVGSPAAGAARKTFAHVPRIDLEANPVLALLRRSFPVTVTLFNPHIILEHRADGTWEIPFLSNTGSGGTLWEDVGPLTVNVRSGSVAVRHEGWNAPVRVEGVNLSVRNSAVKRGLRVEGVLSLPAVSANPFTFDGWVYPSEGCFDFRQKASAVSALAINELITRSPLNVRGGTLDYTLDIRGAIGESTMVRGPVVFSILQIDNLPEFSREIDGTADISFTVNREMSEVLVEKLVIDTGSVQGCLSGGFAFGSERPAVHLRGTLDTFPIEEIVKHAVQERFPTVSDASIAFDRDVRVAVDIHGDIQKPDMEAVASCPASSVAFTVQTDAYGTLNARADLAQTVLAWSAHDGASGNTTVAGGTVRGEKLPFAIHHVSGDISLRDDVAKAGSLNMLLDDVPVSVSGYAELSHGSVPAASATVQCTMVDLSHSRHMNALNELKLSGHGLLTSTVEKRGERVRWDLDSDLTETDIAWREVFHKPGGTAARAHLEGSVEQKSFSEVRFSASLGESCVSGTATVARAGRPSFAALDVRSETLRLAEAMSFLNLPVEVTEDTNAQLAFSLNTKAGQTGATANLTADRLGLVVQGKTDEQPMRFAIENMQASLDSDRNGYRSALRCRSVQLAPALVALLKQPYRPRLPERFGAPLHIDVRIDRLASEPCDIDQLRCAALLSESELTVSSATGSVAGGSFELRGGTVRDDGTFSFSYDCGGCSLGEVLSWLSKEVDHFSGDLSASGSISGVRGDAASRLGQCRLTITNGQIDSSHFISRTRGLEDAAEPVPIEFETLECDFFLDNETIKVSNLQMGRPGLLVQGGGSITLDGEVDHTFDVEMSRAVAEQLSNRKGWGLMEVLRLPGRRSDSISRTFRLTGRLGSLEAAVERRPLHVELIRGTLAFSETLVVAGVTVITAPARMFLDILTSRPDVQNQHGTK